MSHEGRPVPSCPRKETREAGNGGACGPPMHLTHTLVWELTTLDAGATVPVPSFGDSQKAATVWSIGSFGVCTIGLGTSC